MTIPPQTSVTQNQNDVNATNTINDPLYIASSEHQGMVLTNTPFNGSYFHGWRRNVKIALCAKLKLGFLDGSCNKPSVDDVDVQRWIRYWYKGKKAKKSNKLAAHVNSGFDEHFHGDTPFDMRSENKVGFGQNDRVDQKLVVVCQEMMKMFKGKNIMEDRNYASTSHA
nr:sulfotransferase 16 [Tanacetum cinerariifolium]